MLRFRFQSKRKSDSSHNLKYVDVDGSGSIDNDDRVAYGSNEPDVMFGFTNRFTYKDFELSIFLRGQIGGNVLWIGARDLILTAVNMVPTTH